jgi:hypothetical protein
MTALTDRELLELAAKAAGLHFHGHRVGLNYVNCYVSLTGDTDDWFVWAPLTDDGDALRLAVKLRQMRVHIDVESTAAFRNDVHGMPHHFAGVPHGDDPCAATRRAIVRAAAAIGQAQAASGVDAGAAGAQPSDAAK